MTSDTVDSYVDYIDDVTWQRLVGTLLFVDQPEIISRHTDEIFNGVGAGSHLYRVAGAAATGRQPVDWSVVIKVLTLEGSPFQPISNDQASWDYWKREWHIYQSPWQQQLSGALVAPRCVAAGEFLGETDKEIAWIALEDLQALDHRPWPVSHFREVARHLGTFNSEHRIGEFLPTDPWLSRDWLRGWTELAGPFIEMLPTVVDHPVAGRLFTPDLIHDLVDLWEQRQKLYEVLDQLPQTLCHNDVFPRNLFVGRPNHSVVIDWAFCGPAAVGQELTALVGASQVFMESPPECWDDLERDCIDGYLEGLREAGCDGADEALVGDPVSIALRFGIGSIAPVLSTTLTTEHDALVGRVMGCSHEDILANTAALLSFQQRRIHRARALLGL